MVSFQIPTVMITVKIYWKMKKLSNGLLTAKFCLQQGNLVKNHLFIFITLFLMHFTHVEYRLMKPDARLWTQMAGKLMIDQGPVLRLRGIDNSFNRPTSTFWRLSFANAAALRLLVAQKVVIIKEVPILLLIGCFRPIFFLDWLLKRFNLN